MKTEFTEETWPTERWPNFSYRELQCKHSFKCFLDIQMMDDLQEMRTDFGRSMNISSGYRHNTHPIEAAKEKPGAHFTGKAVDVLCSGAVALEILEMALAFGFSGIGVKQHGSHSDRFLHLDQISSADDFHAPRPGIWSYS